MDYSYSVYFVVLSLVMFPASGLGYQAELIIRLLRQGKTYIEVPVNGFDREGSVSFRLRNILSVSHSLFKMSIARLRVSLLK